MWLGLSVEARECLWKKGVLEGMWIIPQEDRMYPTKHLFIYTYIYICTCERPAPHALTCCNGPGMEICRSRFSFPPSDLWPVFQDVLCCWLHPWHCSHAWLINLVFTRILQMIWNKGFIPPFLLVSVSLLSNCLICNSFLVVFAEAESGMHSSLTFLPTSTLCLHS